MWFYVVTLLILVSPSAFATPEVYCSRSDYGLPVYASCLSLLYGTATFRKGIFNLDALDHAFFLPYFGKVSDFTPAQWRHQVTLPELWANHECKIALIVGSNADGSPGTDSGLWGGVAERGKNVVNSCIRLRLREPHGGSGGHVSAGAHGRLFVIVYAWDSPFDLAARGLKPGHRLAIDPAAAGLINMTGSVAIPGVRLFNTTGLTRVPEADEVQDQ